MTYISITDVRRASGAPTSLITDAYITSIIALVEEEVARWMNTKFTPTEEIDIIDGSGNNVIYTRKNPLLAVRALTTNDTTITVSGLHLYKASGKIILGSTAETGSFLNKANDTKISYVYGMVEYSSTSTTTTSASAVGSSVALAVSSETGFAADDWVEVYGTDGYREAAKVSSTAASTITVDQLLYTHASGSKVIKLQIPDFIKRYMEIEAAISVAINAIGATYTFNASYSLGELSVVKGVPYTHWRESVQRLIAEREMRKARIKPRIHMAVV